MAPFCRILSSKVNVEFFGSIGLDIYVNSFQAVSSVINHFNVWTKELYEGAALFQYLYNQVENLRHHLCFIMLHFKHEGILERAIGV